MTTGTIYAWHVHDRILLEPLTAPLEERIAYIKAEKPANEQELRLRLLKLVIGPLPPAYGKAGDTYDKAEAAYDKAGDTYRMAGAAYRMAGAAYLEALATYGKAEATFSEAEATFREAGATPAIRALHAAECQNCTWNGQTIFPEKETP